jgi:uncharacterized delta-60 repeat protein
MLKLMNAKLNKFSKKEDAMTVIELLIVITIIAVITAIAIPFFFGYTAKAAEAVAESDTANTNKAIGAYLVENPIASEEELQAQAVVSEGSTVVVKGTGYVYTICSTNEGSPEYTYGYDSETGEYSEGCATGGDENGDNGNGGGEVFVEEPNPFTTFAYENESNQEVVFNRNVESETFLPTENYENVTYTITEGELPEGVTLNPETGVLSGPNDWGFETIGLGGAGNDNVFSSVLTSDGGTIISGTFAGTATFGSTTLTSASTFDAFVAKINSDGKYVWALNSGSLVSAAANTVAIQDYDGKIIVGGSFNTFDGQTVGRIVRLNSDGSVDTNFSTNVGTGANNIVNAIAVHPDGKILVAGSFTSWNGTTVNRIVRLNSDGTRDTAFTTNTGTAAAATVNSIAVQADGKILVAGSFTTWDGISVGRIVRLNSDGTRDTAFATNTGTGANNIISPIAVQDDGKILVGGSFTTWNGTTVGRIVRLNSDGRVDTAFTTNTGTGAAGTVVTIFVQPNGQILVGGFFTAWNGETVGRIIVLNNSGTVSTTFMNNLGDLTNVSAFRSFSSTASGDILALGIFTGTATFGSDTLISAGATDVFVGKLDSSGNWLNALQGSTQQVTITVSDGENSFNKELTISTQ